MQCSLQCFSTFHFCYSKTHISIYKTCSLLATILEEASLHKSSLFQMFQRKSHALIGSKDILQLEEKYQDVSHATISNTNFIFFLAAAMFLSSSSLTTLHSAAHETAGGVLTMRAVSESLTAAVFSSKISPVFIQSVPVTTRHHFQRGH